MKRPYIVEIGRWNPHKGFWQPHNLFFRSAESAIRAAQRIGDARPGMRHTRYMRPKDYVIVCHKGLRSVWEHPGIIVPSVGELGYW